VHCSWKQHLETSAQNKIKINELINVERERVQWKGKGGMSQEKKEYEIIAPTSKA
jgi:hypothetical protein